MDKNNWLKWSAIAEIISSIAILMTLFFLLLQTLQNNEMMRSQAQLNQMQNSNFINFLILEHPEIAETTFKAFIGEELSELEIYKIEVAYSTAISFWEFEFKQMQAGNLDFQDADWGNTINSPLFLRAWNEAKQSLESDFVNFIETEFILRDN